jgi:hypothetical protein
MAKKLREIQNNRRYRVRLISQNECKSLDERYFGI